MGLSMGLSMNLSMYTLSTGNDYIFAFYSGSEGRTDWETSDSRNKFMQYNDAIRSEHFTVQ